jgi:hypothetical protein
MLIDIAELLIHIKSKIKNSKLKENPNYQTQKFQ